jgi:hypothetical protein
MQAARKVGQASLSLPFLQHPTHFDPEEGDIMAVNSILHGDKAQHRV